MVMRTEDTQEIQEYLNRLRDGDQTVRAVLLDRTVARLTQLARRMLRDFPTVGRWEQTEDVLQNALMRLDRSLRVVSPPTPRDLFRLAAAQIRRELLDLARQYQGPLGLAANHATPGEPTSTSNDDRPERETGDSTLDPARLAVWSEFHRLVERLDDEGREVFDLLWYQGLTRAEAAQVIGVSERTVHRRWVVARMRLGDALGDRVPF